MSNGCICCTLRDDLLAEVSRLALERRFDDLLIESTGIFEPIPVAQTFTFEDQAAEALKDRGESLGDEEMRTVTHLLIDQIEFADVIVIDKLDLVDAALRGHPRIHVSGPLAELELSSRNVAGARRAANRIVDAHSVRW